MTSFPREDGGGACEVVGTAASLVGSGSVFDSDFRVKTETAPHVSRRGATNENEFPNGDGHGKSQVSNSRLPQFILKNTNKHN